MAILIDYRLVRDDPREVEYAFGFPELDRRMVIQKASERGTVLDGEEDLGYRKVYAQVVRAQQASGQWPAAGSYAA